MPNQATPPEPDPASLGEQHAVAQVPPAWVEIKRLAADALEQPRSERRAFVESRTAENAALRERVLSLISADEEQGEDALSADGLEGPRTVLREMDSTGPLEPGDQVGRYRVVRHIGSGGMGAVYEARDDELGRDIALKVIVGAGVGLAWSTSALRRFAGEAKALARLAHPGIAQIHETGTHRLASGVFAPYLILELVKGGVPITAWTQSRPLDLCGKIDLFARVCEGVAHGHQKGVIHRDLKPANILIDAGGEPKLIDFGVARTIESDENSRASQITRVTREGQIVGTIQYMSPEQCQGDGQDVDVRSDVYSLGVVLHEILAGELPYDVRTATLAAAASTIRERPPRPLGQVSKDLSGDIERIVLKALDKEPARRYQSASELAADLRRFLVGEPIIARPPSATYQLRLFARRHRTLVAGTVAAVVCLSLGVVGTTIGLVRARHSQGLADAQSARATRLSKFFLGMVGSAGAAAPVALSGESRQDPWDQFVNGDVRWEAAGVPGHVASVSELIAKAIRRVPIEFADDPLLKADASFEILRTMSRMGLNPGQVGMDLARETAHIYERELGISDRRTIIANSQAAMFFGIISAADISLEHHERAVRGALEAFGPVDPRSMVIQCQYALQLCAIPERRAEAIASLESLRSGVADAYGSDSFEVAELEVSLADVLARCERTDDAVVLIRRSIERLRPYMNERPNALVQALSQLASYVGTEWDGLEEAERAVAEAVSLSERFDTLGAFTNEHRYRHVLILMSLGRVDEAEVIARRSLEVYERVMPPEGLTRLKAQARVVSILVRKGEKLDEAERLARTAAEVYQRVVGEPDEDFVQHHHALLAATLRLQGDVAGAERLVESRLALRRANPYWMSMWSSVSLYLERGRCMTALGRYAEAEKDIQCAERVCQKLYAKSPTYPTWSALGQAYVSLYEAMGDAKRADDWRPIANPGARRADE